jgi:A/G-specific adenine glycosylase
VLRADGGVLLRTRPPAGLLGGMTEVPTSEWSKDFSDAHALEHAPLFGRAKLQWRRVPGAVAHTFTHFPLELIVFAAEVPADAATPKGARWVPRARLADEALPNVMRKVVAHALGTFAAGRRP